MNKDGYWLYWGRKRVDISQSSCLLAQGTVMACWPRGSHTDGALRYRELKMEGGRTVSLFSPVGVALVVTTGLFMKSHTWLFMKTVKPSLYLKELVFSCFWGEMRNLAGKATSSCAWGLIPVCYSDLLVDLPERIDFKCFRCFRQDKAHLTNWWECPGWEWRVNGQD